MAYKLERAEAVVAGLKRVVREEIESANEHLTVKGRKKATRDEAIHESRKSIKKVRALLRLMRAELGSTFSHENARLQEIAGRLSELRDAFAIIGTFDDLRQHYKQEAGKRLQHIRTGLMRKRNAGGGAEQVATVLDDGAAALQKVSKGVAKWPLKTDGYSALGPGLEMTYRAGRNALRRAQKAPTADNFHALRKRVKDHWYHVRLLENIWTDMMRAYEGSLKELETWLGNDHNLAVLRERLVAEPELYGKQNDIELAFELIDKYQKELRDKSLALAGRIYEEKPRELNRRMNGLWDTWRQEPRTAA